MNTSFCVLLYDDGDDSRSHAEERLRVLENNSDGFSIAEADLLLRGPGDVLGIRQKGFVKYR